MQPPKPICIDFVNRKRTTLLRVVRETTMDKMQNIWNNPARKAWNERKKTATEKRRSPKSD